MRSGTSNSSRLINDSKFKLPQTGGSLEQGCCSRVKLCEPSTLCELRSVKGEGRGRRKRDGGMGWKLGDDGRLDSD